MSMSKVLVILAVDAFVSSPRMVLCWTRKLRITPEVLFQISLVRRRRGSGPGDHLFVTETAP